MTRADPPAGEGAGLHVWLDDARPEPAGWVRVWWPAEAIALLAAGRVAVISLDHDLGDDGIGTGYDVARWLEEQVVMHGFTPPEVRVHSANPVGRARMLQAIAGIRRHLDGRADAR